MKTSQSITILAATLILASSAGASEVTGGYLNSKSREAALEVQDGNQRIQIRTAAAKLVWGDAEYGSGALYIINARGRIYTARREFRDAANHAVALPSDSNDKVVVLNRYGNIAWAIGLDDAEMVRLMPRDVQDTARVVAEAQTQPVFAALRYSSGVLKEMRADAESIADMFLTSIHWMAGRATENLVRTLMLKTHSNYLEGVSLVSHGGDGNGGLVSQGGDGNGGTGRVAQGGDGNGGTGRVAQGGDGNGGTGVVAQGGDGNGGTGYASDVEVKAGTMSDIPLPAIPGLSAVTTGQIVVLQ